MIRNDNDRLFEIDFENIEHCLRNSKISTRISIYDTKEFISFALRI